MDSIDMEKLKNMILPELRKIIDEGHKDIFKEIENVKKQIEPISEVYNNIRGSGSVLLFIFGNIIVPSSVIVGIIYSWIQIFGKK